MPDNFEYIDQGQNPAENIHTCDVFSAFIGVGQMVGAVTIEAGRELAGRRFLSAASTVVRGAVETSVFAVDKAIDCGLGCAHCIAEGANINTSRIEFTVASAFSRANEHDSADGRNSPAQLLVVQLIK